MRPLTFSAGLLLIAVLTAGHGFNPTTSEGPLEGAWEMLEQPGLLLFSEGHYSWMTIRQQRELFVDPGNPTDAEWLAACRGIIANSGSYEVSGPAVRLQIMVAKHPNAMEAEQIATLEYSIAGDTLTMSTGGGTEFTFVRLD